MEENFSMEWKIFGMEWKKIASMEHGKIVLHSIPYHALLAVMLSFVRLFFSLTNQNIMLSSSQGQNVFQDL